MWMKVNVGSAGECGSRGPSCDRLQTSTLAGHSLYLTANWHHSSYKTLIKYWLGFSGFPSFGEHLYKA